MTVACLEDVVARAVDLMVQKHGERAEFMADVRCRELCAEGDERAAALWAAVARALRQQAIPQR
jgi:hypothetical protein